MIHQLNPTMDVYAREHGEGTAIFLIDYGLEVNAVFIVRFEGGTVKHFLTDDLIFFGNPLYGKGWDVNIPEDWKPKKKQIK